MKATKPQKRKNVEASQVNTTTIKKPTSTTSGRCNIKTVSLTGKNGYSSTRDVPEVSSFTAVQVVDHQFSKQDPVHRDTNRVQEPNAGFLFGKMKLQLFPVDERTRIGLEKDGHNPYLELTLRARKKISSVLKHLNNKWGSSSVAVGDLMLFPYDIQLENLRTYKRWSLNDNCTCAGDVYADIGSPSLFRLRYGWFSSLYSGFTKLPPGTTVLGIPLQSKGLQKSCGRSPLMDRNRQLDTSHDVSKPSKTSKIANTGVAAKVPVNADVAVSRMKDDDDDKKISATHPGMPWDDSLSNLSIGWLLSDASLLGKINNCDSKSKEMKSNSQPIQLLSSDISIGGLLSEASMQGKFVENEAKLSGEKPNPKLTRDNNCVFPSPVPWDDSFTNLSIGGLLSEASLQAKIDNRNKPGSQPAQLVCDSLDALNIDGFKSQTQTSKPLTQVSHSSILDAEDTCHAFLFGKSSLLEKSNAPFGGSSTLTNGNNNFELNTHNVLVQDHSRQESKTGLLAHQKVHHHDNSLGLGGIKWTESLGAFDINFPEAKQIKSQDRGSISEFVR